MVSRSTCGFSMQQNWISCGQDTGQRHHLSTWSCAAQHQLLPLSAGWLFRSRRCRKNFRLLFPVAYISTKWNWAGPAWKDFPRKANTGKGTQSLVPAAVWSSSLKYLSKTHSFFSPSPASSS